MILILLTLRLSEESQSQLRISEATLLILSSLSPVVPTLLPHRSLPMPTIPLLKIASNSCPPHSKTMIQRSVHSRNRKCLNPSARRLLTNNNKKRSRVFGQPRIWVLLPIPFHSRRDLRSWLYQFIPLLRQTLQDRSRASRRRLERKLPSLRRYSARLRRLSTSLYVTSNSWT